MEPLAMARQRDDLFQTEIEIRNCRVDRRPIDFPIQIRRNPLLVSYLHSGGHDDRCVGRMGGFWLVRFYGYSVMVRISHESVRHGSYGHMRKWWLRVVRAPRLHISGDLDSCLRFALTRDLVICVCVWVHISKWIDGQHFKYCFCQFESSSDGFTGGWSSVRDMINKLTYLPHQSNSARLTEYIRETTLFRKGS